MVRLVAVERGICQLVVGKLKTRRKAELQNTEEEDASIDGATFTRDYIHACVDVCMCAYTILSHTCAINACNNAHSNACIRPN